MIKSEVPHVPVLLTVADLDVGTWNRSSGLCLEDHVNVTLGSTAEGLAAVSLCGGAGHRSVQRGFQLLSYGDTLRLALLAGERRGKRHRGFSFTYQARKCFPASLFATRLYPLQTVRL